MADSFECKTPEDAWAMVSHFLGNCLTPIRMVIQAKPTDWLEVIAGIKKSLGENLHKIVSQMTENGHSGDSQKIAEIARMVQETDLAVEANIDAISDKHQELSTSARDMKALLEKLRKKE
jgi:hypothetical protein